MCVVLAITNTTDSNIKLIQCRNKEDALKKMEKLYEVLHYGNLIDYNNTYYDKELGYAQIVNGITQTEIRIGMLTCSTHSIENAAVTHSKDYTYN